MHLNISHRTRYTYDTPVTYALQQIRLTPKSRSYQSVTRWSTEVEGGIKEATFRDPHDNLVELVRVEPGRLNVSITSAGEVETTDANGIFGEHHGFMPLWLFLRETPRTAPGPEIRNFVRGLVGQDGDLARMHHLSAAIAEAVRYETGRTDSASSAEEALAEGSGVCQDHAHIFIAAARMMGVPARYVSGYLMMDDRTEQEAGHAWAEAHIDGLGWVGFDVSNGISPDERYVRVATGLDYTGAAPVSGMRFGDGGESMVVTVCVQQQ